MSTYRHAVSARRHNALIANTRGNAADTARAIEIVAASFLRSVKDVVARATAAGYAAASLDLVVPDGMDHGSDIALCQNFKDLLDRDPEFRSSALGKRTQLKWVRSAPAQPERPPVPAAVEAPKPVEAKRDAVGARRVFNPLGDLEAQVTAKEWWPSIKHQLAQARAAYPDLTEPVVSLAAPRGLDAGLLEEFLALEAVSDPALGLFRKFTLRVTPAVA